MHRISGSICILRAIALRKGLTHALKKKQVNTRSNPWEQEHHYHDIIIFNQIFDNLLNAHFNSQNEIGMGIGMKMEVEVEMEAKMKKEKEMSTLLFYQRINDAQTLEL